MDSVVRKTAFGFVIILKYDSNCVINVWTFTKPIFPESEIVIAATFPEVFYNQHIQTDFLALN